VFNNFLIYMLTNICHVQSVNACIDGASVDEENGDADTVEALNALVPGMRSNLWIKTVLALLAGTLSFVLFAPL